MSGNKDCREFSFSILRIAITVSKRLFGLITLINCLKGHKSLGSFLERCSLMEVLTICQTKGQGHLLSCSGHVLQITFSCVILDLCISYSHQTNITEAKKFKIFPKWVVIEKMGPFHFHFHSKMKTAVGSELWRWKVKRSGGKVASGM